MAAEEREVILPVGVADRSGRWRRRATIRKMRGHEEALLYDASLSSGKLVTALVANCVTRLEDEPDMTPALAARLYSADRNYLLLEIRRFTLGDALHCAYGCPACGAEVGVVEDLSQIEVRRFNGEGAPKPVKVQLNDGYRDRDGVLHSEISLRLPRGEDEEFLSETAERDPLRARDALILRCTENFGALPRAALEAYGVRILRDLTLGDRNLIYRALEAEAPGVEFRRALRCQSCGAGFETFLDAANFFLLA
jgi:hypothetical protein